MKKQILLLTIFIFALLLSFTACKKEKGNTTDNTTEATTQTQDQSVFSDEVDASANDADAAVEFSPSFTGRNQQVQTTICNATAVYDSISNPRTITITYNGANCFGTATRTGVVVLSIAQGVHWKDAGAVVTITFQNLAITRTSDNKSITINGAVSYTNVSGGLMINLPTLGTITHTITSSNMSVKFDDNTTRTWQIAKQRIFTYNNGVVITSSGTHTDGSVTNIAEWGTNRVGHTFTTSTVQPLVVRQDCNFRLTSGQVKHTTTNVTVTATFGLDASGNPTSCPGTGNYYVKLTWTGPNGNTLTTILPY
jgi:hypothetical protein